MDREYEKQSKQIIQNENERAKMEAEKNGLIRLLTAPFRGIKNILAWIRDTIEYRLMPKNAREILAETAMNEVQTERIKEMKERKIEDIPTSKKKMMIIENEKLEPTEKLFKLCMLCKTSGKTFDVMTNKGAFRFERNADNVFVSHAVPEYKSKNSNPVYNFEKIGGINFKENSNIIEYEDLYGAYQILASGEEFDTERKGIEQNAQINEIGRVTEKEACNDENQLKFTDEEQKKVNEAILAGKTDVVENILNDKAQSIAKESVMNQETIFTSMDENNVDFGQNSCIVEPIDDIIQNAGIFTSANNQTFEEKLQSMAQQSEQSIPETQKVNDDYER